MSNKKQTAVEWLFDRMVGLAEEYEDGIINYTSYINGINHFLDQAKEIHKEEVLNFNKMHDNHEIDALTNNTILLTAEEFYNETYE